MIKEKRFEAILKELTQKGTVTYELLAEKLNVSEDTIRRDIEYLHRNGLLSKVRGGAMLRSNNPLTFQDRQAFQQNEKDIIALKALQFIKNGNTLFMDGGTTNCTIATHLPADIAIRVITNNQALVPILSRFTQVELIVLGGIYYRATATTTGVKTCTDAAQYIADVYCMGTCAVDHELGISAAVYSDAEVKKIMLQSARKTIALASQNKLRRSDAFRICDIQGIDALVTDLEADSAELDDFRHLGLQLL